MEHKLLSKLINRKDDTNKYSYGHVLIIGGSPGTVGAPLLSAMASLRIGAGLVTIASSINVIDKLEKRVLEAMTLRIPENENEAFDSLNKFIKERKISVVLIGPGLVNFNANLIKKLIANISIPTILDAGALTCFKDDLVKLKQASIRNKQFIFTPHDGEFKKLTGIELPSDIHSRKEVAALYSKEFEVVLVSKANKTLVAGPDGSIYENYTGNPGLATAGTGDVLAGIIAGLLAQGFTTFEASQLGVYLHGLAGDIAAQEKTQPGIIASDVIGYLPNALSSKNMSSK
ncbi:MAG: NAD(P)H-hydrate dehydratase [Acidimicrobiia bacterium]|nr:NAD(P)H-hydrate dehydratase [Acidimicrobiia bacterium]